MNKFYLVFLIFSFSISKAQDSQTVYVDKVVNSIQIGGLAGNKNLSFGVRNMAQEILMDREDLLVIEEKSRASLVILIELFYFDIVNTQTGISVFHKDKSTTIIRMRGTLYKNGKKIKQVVSEGTSSEISTSTILIDEGGSFNQESASSATKKTISNLIEKLL